MPHLSGPSGLWRPQIRHLYQSGFSSSNQQNLPWGSFQNCWGCWRTKLQKGLEPGRSWVLGSKNYKQSLWGSSLEPDLGFLSSDRLACITCLSLDLGCLEHSDWPSGGRGWLAEEGWVDGRKLKHVSTYNPFRSPPALRFYAHSSITRKFLHATANRNGPRDFGTGSALHLDFYFYFLFLRVYLFREKGKEGESEGDKHPCARETLIKCLSHAPHWRPGPQPGHVSSLGIEPETFQSAGLCSVPWSTPAKAALEFLISENSN